MLPLGNRQIRTQWHDSGRRVLVTELIDSQLPALKCGEILVEVLFVPIHGSFWLASHPQGIHPRRDEFLAAGGFVFGNGGVGRVVAVADRVSDVQPGDYVSIMGHIPCARADCYACNMLHRYVECDYGEGKIVGHGNRAPDGTYARYCVLPSVACEICFRATERPSEAGVRPYMLAFLLADVRNAMTRHPRTLDKGRLLLIGAGGSGHLAAWLLLHHSPAARILAVDTVAARLASLQRMAPQAVATLRLRDEVAAILNAGVTDQTANSLIGEAADEIKRELRRVFGCQGCDLVFDASSGNTLPLWLNAGVLRPGAHCIPFGFGSRPVPLSSDLVQLSGLSLMMSRGVGDRENRRAAVELVKTGAWKPIERYVLSEAKRLNDLDDAIAFIKSQHQPPKPLHEIPRAYMVPNAFSIESGIDHGRTAMSEPTRRKPQVHSR